MSFKKTYKKTYENASEAMTRKVIIDGKLLDLKQGNPRYVPFKTSMGWNSGRVELDDEGGVGSIEIQHIQQDCPERDELYVHLEIPTQDPSDSRVLKGIQNILTKEGFR